MKTLLSLLLLCAAAPLCANEVSDEPADTHSAEQITIVEAYGNADLPQAELAPGFGRFEDRENAADTFLIIQKNAQGGDGRFSPHEHPLVLSLPAPTTPGETYDVYLRVLAWGAVASCRPVQGLGIGFGERREEVEIPFTETEMLVIKGGTYHGAGRWKWIKVLDATPAQDFSTTKLHLNLVGGSGNYTGLLVSHVGYQKTNPLQQP